MASCMKGKMKVYLPVLGWEGGYMNNLMRMKGNGTDFRKSESVSQIHHCGSLPRAMSHIPVKRKNFFLPSQGCWKGKLDEI